MSVPRWLERIFSCCGATYQEHQHLPVFSALHLAQAEHVSGHCVAKSVFLAADKRPVTIRTFDLRPDKLAAYGLTAADVSNALAKNDYISGLGNTKGQMVQINLTASTSLHSLEEFRNLVIKQSGGAIVRLQDVESCDNPPSDA